MGVDCSLFAKRKGSNEYEVDEISLDRSYVFLPEDEYADFDAFMGKWDTDIVGALIELSIEIQYQESKLKSDPQSRASYRLVWLNKCYTELLNNKDSWSEFCISDDSGGKIYERIHFGHLYSNNIEYKVNKIR